MQNKLNLVPVVLLSVFLSFNLYADVFNMGIMQDKLNTTKKYKPLIEYLKNKKIEVKVTTFSNYVEAAKMFASGELDFMISGSGVAATMILKSLAKPLVRPVHKKGWSTYWAVVLAQKDFKTSGIIEEDLKGKKIGATALASSGEFFARSILGDKLKLLTTPSHGTAIKHLAIGSIDLAIVKNRVWDDKKSKHPNLIKIWEDKRQNPNDTIIISLKIGPKSTNKIKEVFLQLGKDNSIAATKFKESSNYTHYLPTSIEDFKGTLELLKKAGVRADFNYSFTYK